MDEPNSLVSPLPAIYAAEPREAGRKTQFSSASFADTHLLCVPTASRVPERISTSTSLPSLSGLGCGRRTLVRGPRAYVSLDCR